MKLTQQLQKVCEDAHDDNLKKQIDALKVKIDQIKKRYPEGTHIDKYSSSDYLTYSDLVKKKHLLQDQWEKSEDMNADGELSNVGTNPLVTSKKEDDEEKSKKAIEKDETKK